MCEMWCRRLMRLDKYLCKSTELTKLEAVQRIQNGEVSVNSVVVLDESTQVHESNAILLNGDALTLREFRYILMHKPAGTICSNIDEVYPSLFNYLELEKASELHIAGRLDADTTGLVLITDDGRWSFNITLPTKSCKKVYRVTLSRDIKDDVADKFKAGIQLQGEQKLTRPAELEVITSKEVLLTITEGKFHQVKRMFAAVGNRVVGLHREQIGDVRLDVEAGQWRYLTKAEVDSFQQDSQ
ncbi:MULTISPECIES: pseudouridine synthase [unclassified Vibrio]|uniref:pseudouridine synthase n=1 Tax=unclassified Vibrio TaxID=2614977 RepID=UPI0021A37D0B|nr:pseudouridine synthase [Vibrio sp. NC2]MCT4347473.1 pseudouridine synthase [Vibrio sp. NC2]